MRRLSWRRSASCLAITGQSGAGATRDPYLQDRTTSQPRGRPASPGPRKSPSVDPIPVRCPRAPPRRTNWSQRRGRCEVRGRLRSSPTFATIVSVSGGRTAARDGLSRAPPYPPVLTARRQSELSRCSTVWGTRLLSSLADEPVSPLGCDPATGLQRPLAIAGSGSVLAGKASAQGVRTGRSAAERELLAVAVVAVHPAVKPPSTP